MPEVPFSEILEVSGRTVPSGFGPSASSECLEIGLEWYVAMGEKVSQPRLVVTFTKLPKNSHESLGVFNGFLDAAMVP